MLYLKNIILKNFYLRFATNLFIQLVALYIFCVGANPFLCVASIIALGLCMVNGVELVHECLHMTAFKKPFVNKIAGILLSAPIFISFSAYRRQHLWHHSKIGTPDDMEFFRHTSLPQNRIAFLKGIFNPTDLLRKIVNYYATNMKIVFGGEQQKLKNNSIIEIAVSAVIVMTLVGSFMSGNIQIPLFYLCSLFLVFNPVHHLVEFPEHAFCDTKAKLVTLNTRSITGSFISMWFTNYNNLHVEHHQYPSVKFYDLIPIHDKKKAALKYTNISYLEFYSNFWLNLKPQHGERSCIHSSKA